MRVYTRISKSPQTMRLRPKRITPTHCAGVSGCGMRGSCAIALRRCVEIIFPPVADDRGGQLTTAPITTREAVEIVERTVFLWNKPAYHVSLFPSKLRHESAIEIRHRLRRISACRFWRHLDRPRLDEEDAVATTGLLCSQAGKR